MYNLVKKAQAIGLKAAQVGVSGKEIDKTVRDFIEQDKKYGKLFLHGTGHGVGVEIHEYPNVNRNNNLPMKPNHVITIEPGVYKEGFGGVRIEDTIVISEKGPIILTKKSPK
jgi:Xaa-Pro aminopeptidase